MIKYTKIQAGLKVYVIHKTKGLLYVIYSYKSAENLRSLDVLKDTPRLELTFYTQGDIHANPTQIPQDNLNWIALALYLRSTLYLSALYCLAEYY